MLILLIITITLGVIIFNKQQIPQNLIVSDKQKPFAADDNSSQISTSSADIASLLESFPTFDSTQEEKNKFFANVKNAAKESDILDISRCKPNPPVLLLRSDKEFQIVNNDKVEHIITRGGQQYSIPAGQAITIRASSFGTTGVLGYRCLTYNGEYPIVGIINIIE